VKEELRVRAELWAALVTHS
jgi:hypothetical protein